MPELECKHDYVVRVVEGLDTYGGQFLLDSDSLDDSVPIEDVFCLLCGRPTAELRFQG